MCEREWKTICIKLDKSSKVFKKLLQQNSYIIKKH